MPNRSSILPIEIIKINVYKEDLAYLKAKYGSGSHAKLGYGPAMREIIHAAVKRLREKERQRLEAAIAVSNIPPETEIEYAINPNL